MKKYLLIFILSLACLYSYTQTGSPDPAFGTAGIVTTSFGVSTSSVSKSMAVQTDGKTIMAGYTSTGGIFIFAVARYNTDGSLDNTFDTDGKLTTAFGSSDDKANSLAIQTDGKIIAAGFSYNGSHDVFALARYNTDGSLDNTFDGDGKLTTDFSGSIENIVNSIAIQTDGKIIVSGSNHNGTTLDFALARYNTDGSLDNTFDGDGKLTTAIGTSDDIAYSLALQTDGKIVVAGNSDIGGNLDFALARYNTNGSLDNTFDGDGKLITPVGTSNAAEANSIEIQPDGKIIVSGFAFVGAGRDFALVRYNTNGSLDNSFDGDGKVTTNINGNDFGFAMRLFGQRIYVGGESNTAAVFALVAYQTGSLLPLHLLSFSGKKLNNTIQLNWVAENEINASHFNIEKSSNGIAFTKIGEVAAINSSGRNEYTFNDVQPVNEKNYYRLKQTDKDGSFIYSAIIKIVNDINQSVFTLTPNPATHFLNIIYGGKKEMLTINIYNIQGKLVKQQIKKNEVPIKVAINELQPGMYIIKVADGESVQQGKFIKQ